MLGPRILARIQAGVEAGVAHGTADNTQAFTSVETPESHWAYMAGPKARAADIPRRKWLPGATT